MNPFSEMPSIRVANESLQASMAAMREAQEAPTARRAAERIFEEIQAFEAELDEASEVGIHLVQFGPTTVIHVRRIDWYQPNLLVMHGTSGDGLPVRLVQHLSQLNFLMTRVPRLDPDAPRRAIGFHDTAG
jgi:hypothetical protein